MTTRCEASGNRTFSYRDVDLNVHNGAWTNVDPLRDGILPGRAYATAGKAPVLTNYAGEVTDAGADCVAALTNAGGSIGYRTLLAHPGPTDAMEPTDYPPWRERSSMSHHPSGKS